MGPFSSLRISINISYSQIFKSIVLNVVLLEVYTTYGESVLSATKRTDLGVLAPCAHEEADTRLMVHALGATSRGHRRIRIRSNDTDVVVLAISVVSVLQADEVWVTHGCGKKCTKYSCACRSNVLGP